MGVRCGPVTHYLREYMTTINEHYTSKELKHLRVNASIHSSTPAEFEAKRMYEHMKHRERSNSVETAKFFEGFQPPQYDSIFGAMTSWIKWKSHQHMVCHKYAQTDHTSFDPNEQYQSLVFDPFLDDRQDLNGRGGAIRPAPKIPFTVESCERYKHIPHEALVIGGNDQSWHYPLQLTVKHVHSAAAGSSVA